jgi:hypothetical protein
MPVNVIENNPQRFKEEISIYQLFSPTISEKIRGWSEILKNPCNSQQTLLE